MLLRFLYILETDVEKRDVAVSNQDIGKVGQIPQCSQIHAYDGSQHTEADDDDVQYANDIDKYFAAADTVCADFGEGHKAQ